MIDRVRTVLDDVILSPLRRYLTSGTTDGPSNDRPGRDAPGPPGKQPPEDHVLELLEERGGRMWQQSIFSETGYSEAHVSRLLCRMEDDGLVDRRWSRGEKIVILDEEPTDAVGSELTPSA